MMARFDTRLFALLASTGSMIAFAAVDPAFAQQAAEPAPVSTSSAALSGTPEVADIVVTASRTNVAGFQAPTPTTVVGAAAIDRRQATNIADVLQELPAFKPSTSPSANGVKTQLPGANQADLRSLGPNRTLVLVDGMRVVPQAPANNTGTGVSPDLNQIPSLMVERVDVVTGGASAQWGSDAVAGVVNIILRKHFEGVRLTAQAGVSTFDDAGTRRIGGIAGTNLAGDRLHIVAALDYSQNDEVGDIYNRPFGRQEYQIVSNSASATNGLPVNLIVPNVHFYSSPDLLVTNSTVAAFRNMTFNRNGTLSPFQTGSLISGTAMIGGQGQSQAAGLSLVPGFKRLDPYFRVQYDVSPTTNIYLVGSYSTLRVEMHPLPSRISGGTIRGDNAYLQQLYPSVAAALGPAGTLTFNRANYDFNAPGVNGPVIVHNKTPHLAGGAEGDLGGGWKWDAHAGWGRNVYTNATYNNGIKANETFATDAVLVNGVPTCRALVPGSSTYNPVAAAGCVPINLFGSGAPSASAVGYVIGTARSRATYEQTSAAGNIHGTPFSTWAGPAAIAAGVEYRREKEVVTADAISAAGGFEIANAAPFSGAYDVKEGYVEAVVPMLKDSPIGRSLDLNGAVRVASYSTVGTQTTWKGGATYEPVRGLRFRGTASLDIRAPALFELYSPGSIANNSISVRNPGNGITYTANIPTNLSAGNANLKPERAHTYTAGVVVGPLSGFNVSIDYYDINVEQAITTLNATSAASFCNSGNTFYCSAFTFGAAGPPTALNLGVQNLASVHVEGFDGAISYRMPLSRISPSMGGSLEANVTGTYTRHVYVNTGTGSIIDRANENSPLNTYATPRLRINGSLTYAVGGFSGTVQANYISAGVIDQTYNTSAAVTSNLNHVAPYTYINFYISQDIGKQFQIFASVRNAFNIAPPPLPSTTLNVATNGVYYDTIGRYFTVGARVKF